MKGEITISLLGDHQSIKLIHTLVRNRVGMYPTSKTIKQGKEYISSRTLARAGQGI